MRWLTRLKAAINGAITGWKGENFDFTNWMGRTFWGIDNSTLATNETIFSVITRLSNSLASLPLKLYRNYDLASNQAADVLINGPNANMTSFEFIRNLETIRNEKGNSYALIERDIRGQVARLTPLNPDYVDPVFDTDTGDLWYQVIGNNGTYYFYNMDVLHFKHIIGSSAVKGISPIKVLANTNDFDRAVREFSLKEMQSAPNSFILKYAANVDMEKRQRVIDDFKRFYQDNGGILFQEPGVEIDPIERKFIAADIFTSERITRSRVANVFNVPAHMLNDSEGQSYSSMEQLMREFVQLTLMPIVRQYEQEFNRKLLAPTERQAGYYFKFNVNALLRGDTATQSDYYMKGIRTGWLKPNEVRQLEDLPPEPGGEKLYLSGDLYPIDMDPSLRKGVKSGENAANN
ncbi:MULTISPECIES: phage portal protein [Thermoactinomyces]|uniref:Phage portal protein n=1 Tax=Thermoactinomyces daqus TaxID=1329516 RepID=A0A7W2AJG7_9BACL|nr:MULTISPECIES: phage portal protein [Thermoactinomyces]MBA4544365.1 phage portal protein [Thermoactinomyces daqus]MBH8605998.1 phage portal protein [Thermoactinomyces sp. CICC 10521]